MPGVKGAGGPPPKRSSQRRRANAPANGAPRSAPAGAPAPGGAPKPKSSWHPVAARWFAALGESGQSVFYEPSDWASAAVIAESISRELREYPTPRPAAVTAWLRAMGSLLATEGERRRAAVELTQAEPAGDEEAEDVSWIDDARARLRGSG